MMRFLSLLCLWLPLTTAATSTYSPCILCINQASPRELARIEIRLYTGSTVNDYESVLVGDAVKLFDNIDNSKPTVAIVFGWLSSPDYPSTIANLNGYLERGDHNVMLLDWTNINQNRYTYAASSVEGVGYTLATALNNLVAVGLNATGLHVVGHSLGAHIAGFTGRFVDSRLPRITGLDPAGPLFYITIDHLTANDAEFVDIIHSDMGVLGILLETGHVDFYPNGGRGIQPGCEGDTLLSFVCSHYRSMYYYAASLKDENSLTGVECNSNFNFRAGLCNSNQKEVLGIATPTTARGSYYLEANTKDLDVQVGDDLAFVIKSGINLEEDLLTILPRAVTGMGLST